MTTIYDALKTRAQWTPREIILLALVFLIPILWPGKSLLVNDIAIVAIFALSLDLVVGYTGIVSLGHAAFFGVGAYSAALFAKFVMVDPILGLIFAVIISAVLGAIFSVTVLRGSTLTIVMVTLAASLILFELANKMVWLTGGADGLQGVVIGPLLGLFDFDLMGRTSAYYSLCVGLCLLFLVRRLVHSPFCATLVAIRDNRLRAAAIGVPVGARIAACYTVAAGIAGAAGALLAQTNSFASLDVFDIVRSADVLLMLIIGGVGWLYGGILGAIAFKILQSIFSQITPEYWLFWMGLVLVILMLVGRDRLFRPWAWFRGSL